MSSMHEALDLIVSEVDGATVLRAPDVGWFTLALPRGAVVAPGETAGVLTRLGTTWELRVPASAQGEIASDPPALVRQPVGYGDVLYRLSAVASTATSARSSQPAKQAASGSNLVLRAPQSGRFYHRPAPGEPPFVTVGSIVADGQPIGMIEVMKTFSHVAWRATRELPARARVTAFAAGDGADVKSGDVLLELEPLAASAEKQ
jgi:acetyl-CoA carboxylase biotin carboxyl carrier protein